MTTPGQMSATIENGRQRDQSVLRRCFPTKPPAAILRQMTWSGRQELSPVLNFVETRLGRRYIEVASAF